MNFLARIKRRHGESDRPDFAGKILVIYCNSQERSGGMFEDVRLVMIGFSDFLVGRRVGLKPLSQQRWSKATIWISINDVAQMMVFDDVESANRAFLADDIQDTSDATSVESSEV